MESAGGNIDSKNLVSIFQDLDQRYDTNETSSQGLSENVNSVSATILKACIETSKSRIDVQGLGPHDQEINPVSKSTSLKHGSLHSSFITRTSRSSE